MKVKRTLGGFTLTEIVIAMVLFSIVVAASGSAVYTAITLLYKQTNRTISSAYADSAMDFITEKIRYGINVEILSSPTGSLQEYAKYFDSNDDIVLYVDRNGAAGGRKIYIVNGSISGGKTALFEMSEKDLILKCKPNKSTQSAELSISVTERGKPNEKILDRSSAVRRKNTHIGSFKTDSSNELTENYYILIDNG